MVISVTTIEDLINIVLETNKGLRRTVHEASAESWGEGGLEKVGLWTERSEGVHSLFFGGTDHIIPAGYGLIKR